MAVSGSLFRTQQRLMISAASSTVATFNSPGRGAAQLTSLPYARCQKEFLLCCAWVAWCVCKKMYVSCTWGVVFLFPVWMFKAFQHKHFHWLQSDFATKYRGMPAAVFPQLLDNLHSLHISPPAMHFLLCDTNRSMFWHSIKLSWLTRAESLQIN